MPKRRSTLGMGVGIGLLATGLVAQESPSAASLALKKRALKSDGIALEFPPLSDTGNAVALRASINAPAGLSLSLVEVFLPENPNPLALQLRLVEPQAYFSFSTRLRLAASQEAWVIATFSDGSQRGASAATLITSSACFDAS